MSIISKIAFLQLKCYAALNLGMWRGNINENALDKVSHQIKGYTEKMKALVDKLDGRPEYDDWTRDESPMTLTVDSFSDAFGTDTSARSQVKVAAADLGDVTIAYGRSISYASGNGENPFAAAGVFSAVGGTDYATSHAIKLSGGNFEGSAQVFAAIDWDFLKDRDEFHFDRQRAYTLDHLNINVRDGNVASAEAKLLLKGEGTYSETYTDAVAIDMALSSSFASGYGDFFG